MRVVSILLHPFIPDSSALLLATLGIEGEEMGLERARFGSAVGGGTIGTIEPMFPRVEREPAPAG